MVKKYLLITILFNIQIILSQNIEVLEDRAHDATISTEKANFLNSLSSKDKEIPIFLVDEGLALNDCEKEIGIEKTKKCSIDELESILKEKLKPNLLVAFHKDDRILISTTVIIDTTGKVKYKDVLITKEGLKVQDDEHLKLAAQVEQIVKDFPKLSPAKKNGTLQTVRTNIKTEIIMFD